ncbi:MAG: M3 family metallopeptidase [Candidatus Thorarchaeota archaeon]
MEEDRTWDLSNIVKDTSIEGLTKELDLSLIKVQAKVDGLRENQKAIGANQLVNHLMELEDVAEEIYNIAAYSYCKYVSDTTTDESQALISLFSRCRSKGDELLEGTLYQILGNIMLEQPSIIEKPDLREYRHLLEKASKSLPYILSPVEEEIITEKDTNGISALHELHQSWIGSQMIDVEIDGEKKSISVNQAFSLLTANKRATREAASEAYFGFFARDRLIHVTALRAICSDHITMTKRRRWPSYMTQSLNAQDVDERTINSLLNVIETESASLQRFLKLKTEYFGMEKLPAYDLRAPWLSKPIWDRNWSETKASVIQAYMLFDEEIGNFVRSIFESRQVDSKDGPGRASTAFTFPIFAKKTSFVFATYSGTLGQAYNIAHEIGHSVHCYFTDSTQRFLNANYSVCIAETGSIFGELLFTEQLLRECKSDEMRLEILAKMLDRFYQWTFHIGLYALFEKGLYESILSGKYLDTERVCEIWRTVRQRIYGDTVEWSKNLDYDWARWNQLFEPNYRFYNYSYSFAQLLVFALYDDYKENPMDFSKRFKLLLSRGSSMSPKDQIAEMGYDISKPDFWTLGISQATSLLDELERTI